MTLDDEPYFTQGEGGGGPHMETRSKTSKFGFNMKTIVNLEDIFQNPFTLLWID